MTQKPLGFLNRYASFELLGQLPLRCRLSFKKVRARGVARKFADGRAAHSEDQNDEKMKNNIIEEKSEKMKNIRKHSYLARPRVRPWLRLRLEYKPCEFQLRDAISP